MSGTASLQVLATDPTPPYEQLRRQLASMIQSGVIATGDRLPPVRQLAADLGLAVGTVARTYRELEAAGLVATRRGGGTRVKPPPASPSPAARRQALREHAETYLRHARQLGATDDEVHQAVIDALADS